MALRGICSVQNLYKCVSARYEYRGRIRTFESRLLTRAGTVGPPREVSAPADEGSARAARCVHALSLSELCAGAQLIGFSERIRSGRFIGWLDITCA